MSRVTPNPRDPDALAAYLLELERKIERLAGGSGPPRLTTAQRDRLLPIASYRGAVIFNESNNRHEGCNGVSWNALY